MADPIDISKLSDEELEVYHDLLSAHEMKDPRNAPGPAAVPKLNGMGANWMFKPTAGDVSVDATAGADPELLKLAQSVSNSPVGQNAGPAGDHRLPESKDFAGLLPGPDWLKLLNGMTTHNPADLLTSAALHGSGAVMDGVKAATPAKNAILGALKGFGQFEGGTRIHAAASGQDQPSINPMERNPWENVFGGLSGALGGAAGYKQIPTEPDAKQIIKDAYASFQKKLEAQQAVRAGAYTDLQGAANSHADSVANLSKVEQSLSPVSQKLLAKQKYLATLQDRLSKGTFDDGTLLDASGNKISTAKIKLENSISKTAQEIEDLKTQKGNLPVNPDEEIQKHAAAQQEAQRRATVKESAQAAFDAAKKQEQLMNKGAPPKPQENIIAKLQNKPALLKALSVIAGMGAEAGLFHGGGGIPGIALGGASGIIASHAMTSPQVQKLLAFLGQSLPNTSDKVVPALVNGSQNQ